MKLRDPKTWIVILTLIIVGVVFYKEFEKNSPGPLSAAHAQESRLMAGDGCSLCHGSGNTWTECLSCHAAVGKQIDAQKGLHGTLAPGSARACATCHGEHEGSSFNIAGPRAFEKSGIRDINKYDHAALGFKLAGKHSSLQCKDCHKTFDVAVIPKDQHRFGGLTQACESCHEDPHKGQMKSACSDCHEQLGPFKDLSTYVHILSFPLVGAHRTPGCLECHKKESTHAIEALAGKTPPPTSRTCVECHASPHRSAFVESVALGAAKPTGESCLLCHDPTHKTFVGTDAAMTSARHAATGFPLTPPHSQLKCDDCHRKDISNTDFKQRYPGRTLQSCEACHKDAHRGEFINNPAFAKTQCTDCHKTDAFKPSKFGVPEHAKTPFPLLGKHVQVDCLQCHKAEAVPAGTPPRFDAAQTACAQCHRDPHGGAFSEAPFESKGCEVCHKQDNFTQLQSTTFDHAKWTRFSLVGAHSKTTCDSCHPARTQPDANGRRFGFVKEKFPGNNNTCQGCHADPHRGSFLNGPNSARCENCHTQENFSVLAGGKFDHDKYTAFQLRGAHTKVACESCHVPGVKPDSTGRKFGFVADRFPGDAQRCDTCHKDPHLGAFDVPGRPTVHANKNGCERCHTQESFVESPQLTAFDHKLWTGWSLDGKHAQSACTACHIPSTVDPVRRTPSAARATTPAQGSQCASCHADVHAGQFAEKGATNCARCHDVSPAFAAARFDHQRDSRFKLDSTHTNLKCASCHVASQTVTGALAVRYRPLGTECVDCHKPPGTK
ncbi:MAG: hypothetical protein HY286_06495 [Planctomycetes bacterium]|nr:hypothetical protein [Planctomycetota bacterium]